jgi:ABC-type branched-subunit amino acid transport system substrate-binding protein
MGIIPRINIMKKTLLLFCIFTLLLLLPARQAEAQFWKKLFKKEQPKHKPPVKKPPVKEKPTVVKPVKKKEVSLAKSEMKTRYRVDILVPLYLDELVQNGKPTYKGKIPDKATSGLDFYDGVKLAADSLNMLGYSIDVHVHDIMDPENTVEKLAKKKALDSSDLIIGAVQSQQIPIIAEIAKKNKINFISTISPSDGGVNNNPYFTLLQPSLQSHCEWIMDQVKNKAHKNEPIIFYRTGNATDENAFKYLTESKNDKWNKLSCNTIPTEKQLSSFFDSTKTNVIIVAIIDYSYGEKILQELYTYFPGYRFEVYGMPSWRSMPSLRKPEAYPNVAVYVTVPFYYDATTPNGQKLTNKYKTLTGGNRPGEFVYRGYETMFWYSYLLKKYGTVFNEKFNDNAVAPFTKFEIKAQWDNNDDLLYNENKHIYLYRYQSSSFTIVQ